MTYESMIYAARQLISKHSRKKCERLLSTINEYQADLGFANKITTNYGLRSSCQYFQLLQYLAKQVIITTAAQQQCEVIC